MLTRAGGMGAGDVAGQVSQAGPSVLQSPGDGQLLVMPTSGAEPLDEAQLSSLMVDAQMEGKPASQAIQSALGERGYEVYQRQWGDWLSPFVRQAAQTV
jgi:hypothetical protein